MFQEKNVWIYEMDYIYIYILIYIEKLSTEYMYTENWNNVPYGNTQESFSD